MARAGVGLQRSETGLAGCISSSARTARSNTVLGALVRRSQRRDRIQLGSWGFDTAATSADTLLDLLSNILDYSKIKADHIDLERIAFSPGRVLRGVADLLCPRALLGNAVTFTERGGVQISARCENADDEKAVLIFGVSDTGIGIDAEAQKRIFNPFTQANSSMSRRFGAPGSDSPFRKN